MLTVLLPAQIPTNGLPEVRAEKKLQPANRTKQLTGGEQPRLAVELPESINQSADALKLDFITSPRRLLTAPELFDAPDEWITRSLHWANYIFDTYPPSLHEHPVRRAALIRLDDLLHIESAPHKRLIQQFYKERMEQAISQIEQTKVSEGVRIWKLYNHGFFVRTKSVSFTFDLVPGGGDPDFALSPDQIKRLAFQSDATFISHLHTDHASKEVARAFLSFGKPVLAPPDLWKGDPEFQGKLVYPRRGTTVIDHIELIAKRASLRVIAYPGHQGALVENNVYLVTTPDGYTVVHTGDQDAESYSDLDFYLFTEMGRTHKVDVLLPNVWTTGLNEIIRRVHPGLVITGHENEMAHVVPHREDYTQSYNRLYATSTPYLVMTWGETYLHQSPRRTTNNNH